MRLRLLTPIVPALFVFAGCTGGGGGGGSGDAAMLPDLAVTKDLAMGPPDLLMLAPSGDPCTKNADCAKGLGPNQNPTCIKTQMLQSGEMRVWEDGYCTTTCRTARNDPNNNGINADCPGGNATCSGSSATGECRSLCENSMDCRTGYACFVVNNIAPLGCMPKSLSECDPGKRGNCPRMCPDGGSDPDGGMACYENTCVNTGDGTVGACVPGCQPIGNLGCPGTDGRTDCHASTRTGEGLCTGPGPGGMPGATCGRFYEDCVGGSGCYMGKCQKYCKDDGMTVEAQCGVPGAKCVKLSMNVLVDQKVIGFCTASK